MNVNKANMNKANIVPALRYRNAQKAIEWLCEAFGFEQHVVVPGENGAIAHAQLTLGNGMFMLGSVAPGEYGKLTKQPDETGAAVTQSVYIIVPYEDAHHRRATAAGAEIVIYIKNENYDGRDIGALISKENLWNFGTYDPWA